jgi:SAM-dependent methyltransferase
VSDNFYRVFEDRFRGSRELITSRLQVYLPFLEAIASLYPAGSAMDLGCGRGEWLELLRERGMRPRGYDIDEGMLEACVRLGLPAERRDAIEALSMTASESQAVVSGFHIAEHMPFDVLRTLVKDALRVLKPGGLLILETPNPENFIVGTCNFYLDPSHLHPLPPLLLAFLPEYYGFKRVKVHRLPDPPQIQNAQAISLVEVLFCVSSEYSIIAQKDAEPEVLKQFDEVFGKEYGIELSSLATRYDQQHVARLDLAVETARNAEAIARNAETIARNAEKKAKYIEGIVKRSLLWTFIIILRKVKARLWRHGK